MKYILQLIVIFFQNQNETKCRQIFFDNSSNKSNFCSESNINNEISDTTICENEAAKKSDSSELSASDENDGIQDESTDAEYSEKLSDMLTMWQIILFDNKHIQFHLIQFSVLLM